MNAANWAVVRMYKLKDVKELKSITTFHVDKVGVDSFRLIYLRKGSYGGTVGIQRLTFARPCGGWRSGLAFPP